MTLRVLHLLREEVKVLMTPMPSTAPSGANTPGGIGSPVPSVPATPGGLGHMLSPSLSMSSATLSAHLQQPSGSAAAQQQQRDPFDLLRPALLGRRADSAFGSGFSIADLIGSASSSSLAASAAVSAAGSAVNSDGAQTPHASGGSGHTSPGPVPPARTFSSFFARKQLSGAGEQGHDMDLSEGEEEEEDDDEGDEDEDTEEDDDDEPVPIASRSSKGPAGAAAKASKAPAPQNNIAHQIKPLLIQAIQELLDELETVNSNIARDARDHIHSGETVLVMGRSRTVEAFLKAAAKDRKFTVIVAETAPSYCGHQTARVLSSFGISTILVPDSSIYSMMPRVSKVIIGAHAVLANGGLLGEAGCAMTALAAKKQSTPIVVCAGIYKICPHWEWAATPGQDGSSGAMIRGVGAGSSLNLVAGGVGFAHPPSQVLPFDESTVDASVIENTEVVSPMLEYVSPQHVDVFITNVGDFPPSYIYRLIKENYHEEDLRAVSS